MLLSHNMKAAVFNKISIPTWFTLLRILLIPIFMILFYWPFPWHHWICAIVFATAALTDWLDGFLARQLKQTSALGSFLDPVADKLIVVTVLVLLVSKHHSIFFTLPAVIIIGREITISALREWMAEIGKRTSVAVTMMGKLKTVTQMLAVLLFLILLPTPLGTTLYAVAYTLLYVSAALTLWSMCLYGLAARRALRQ